DATGRGAKEGRHRLQPDRVKRSRPPGTERSRARRLGATPSSEPTPQSMSSSRSVASFRVPAHPAKEVHMEHDDPRLQRALARYQVISALVASPPPRGQRGQLRSELAARTWLGADGEPFTVSAETIRAWERRYRRGGLEALLDKERPRRGVEALPPEVIEKACALKREVPERT